MIGFLQGKASTVYSGGIFRRAAVIFLLLASAVAGVMFLLFHVQWGAALAVTRANEEKAAEIARQRIVTELDSVLLDIRYLTQQQFLKRWFERGDSTSLIDLANEYRLFSMEKRVYDQIRLIDLSGREQVRVNWNAGNPEVTPRSRLQDKVDRYYVHETLKLSPNEVYISPFDLNLEEGAIEQPIKPMIRFGALAHDADGNRKGMVILNYLGKRLISRIKALTDQTSGHLWLLNQEGYWLIGPTPADEWTFMYPDTRGRSFANSHPTAWARIKGSDVSGQLMDGGNLFTYSKIVSLASNLPPAKPDSNPTFTTTEQNWFVVTQVSSDGLANRRLELLEYFVLAFFALAILLILVAALVARHAQRRKEAEQHWRDSEKRFRSLLESAPDSVVITDTEGKIVLVNAQSEMLFGYQRESLVGQPVEMLLPDRFREQHVGHRRGYLSGAKARPMGLGLELFGLRSDGGEFPVAISLSPVETDEGKLVISSIRDVTEMHEAAREINNLNNRLERDNNELLALNKEMEAFSYSVSHDLRAPLRAIDGFSQALLEDCADVLTENGKSHLERVRQAAQRMGYLIDDLLKLSRVTRSELQIGTVNLSLVAQGVVDGLLESGARPDVNVTIAPDLIARGDARLLGIALENLIGNAWKFTGDRPSARIEFGQRITNGKSAFFVRDNGVGFDMAYADQLFRAFQRLHDAREFPGTGIGLATVQRIIRKHGGDVWAESETGKGAAFYFTLQQEKAS
ncbi:sensor histidine kinase [Limibacillus halophilus]|uniref:histidine kinase n=1 Tax=Limibacillus halophilus TaxID=1579333 RepID=A0A839SWN3_9PROT|nr:PAS domain S-box protein [Limibacillus halophilus]MBB3065365.1 PAS domain S-box-containing protein [Limibacillus halophilus]